MAILKTREIREMDRKARNEKLSQLKSELLRMRTLIEGGGTVKEPGKVSELKRAIARIYTINNEEDLGIAPVKTK